MVNEKILTEAQALRKEVKGLREELHESKGVVRRLRWLTWGGLGLFFAFVGYVVANESQENKDQYAQCLNMNERASSILDGWHFVLGYELADKSEYQAPAETAMSRAILPWFDIVYAPRDCNNLDKVYDIPPVPKIPEQVN